MDDYENMVFFKSFFHNPQTSVPLQLFIHHINHPTKKSGKKEFTAKVVFLWKKKPKLIQFTNYLPKYSFESTSAIHVNKPSSSNLFFYFGDPIFFPKSTIQKVFSSLWLHHLRLHFLSSPAAAPTSGSHQQLGKFFSGS